MSSSTLDRLIQIHHAKSTEAAVPLITDEITALYHGIVNSPDQLLDIAREKADKGFQSIGLIVPAGEEQGIVANLTADLVDQLHHIK